MWEIGPCFVMRYLVSCLVLQSCRWGGEGWLVYFSVGVLSIFLVVPWVGLRCLVMTISGHIHFLDNRHIMGAMKQVFHG